MPTFVLEIVNRTNAAPCIERVALDRATWIDGPSIAEGDHITADGDVAGGVMFDAQAQVSRSTLDVVYDSLRAGRGEERVTVEFGAAMVKDVATALLGATPSSMSRLITEVYLVQTPAVFTGFVVIRPRPENRNATWLP